MRKKVQGASCAEFQVSATKINATIEPWDIDREVKEGYLADHMALVEFVDGGSDDARKAVALMRPLLEKYIRYRFPNAIPDDKWLGEMLAIIRATDNHPLATVYDEIDDINEFTAPFHHDPSTPLNVDEVRDHSRRTLKVVGGS